MTSPRELADMALEMARRCITDHGRQLARHASADIEALVNAAQIIRSTDYKLPESERGAEHVAFAFLTAATSELTQHS